MTKKSAAFSNPEKLHLIQLPTLPIIQWVASGIDEYIRYDKYPNLEELRKFVTETVCKNKEVTKEQSKMWTEIAVQLLTLELSYVDVKHLRTSSQPKPDKRLLADEVEFERVWREFKKLEKVERNDHFDEIIGKSQAIRNVIEGIKIVKDSDATVLVTGEPGVGKDLVARVIHNHSNRTGNLFVYAILAGFPPNLVDSELFGYEKGAFTGADKTKIGKFEIANKGTIFIDEVGELNLETQLRLLHVLREGEIEHIVGTKTIPVDVRVIAATNKNIKKAVNEGTFRLDLFYRLETYPIHVPSVMSS